MPEKTFNKICQRTIEDWRNYDLQLLFESRRIKYSKENTQHEERKNKREQSHMVWQRHLRQSGERYEINFFFFFFFFFQFVQEHTWEFYYVTVWQCEYVKQNQRRVPTIRTAKSPSTKHVECIIERRNINDVTGAADGGDRVECPQRLMVAHAGNTGPLARKHVLADLSACNEAWTALMCADSHGPCNERTR